ncbi:hypothetical protein FRX31_007718 [Thalictrum thalictroides]|uniref:MATH domain-containing protein n=1 Tax=Thalictrum thalictroides TaxID=46969 RepID=A0A7J6WZ43_THATH|nr:hypothetical protein FRX31_007718 [Thalictrum thalictroides]
MKDQLHGEDQEMEGVDWFDGHGWGDDEFIELECLNDFTEGFLVNDSLIIEAEVCVLGSSVSICTGSTSTA